MARIVASVSGVAVVSRPTLAPGIPGKIPSTSKPMVNEFKELEVFMCLSRGLTMTVFPDWSATT